jgi:hypothetical protein
MKKISDRILQILNNENISTRFFEIKIGASNGLIHRCVGKGSDISSAWVSKIIENFPHYNARWLLTGEGSMFEKEKEYKKDINSPKVVAENEQIYSCIRCQEKERLIKSQDERISELKDIITILRKVNLPVESCEKK